MSYACTSSVFMTHPTSEWRVHLLPWPAFLASDRTSVIDAARKMQVVVRKRQESANKMVRKGRNETLQTLAAQR